MTAERGFTLAELMVSLSVGGILLSLAVPSYSTFVRNSQQVTAANDLLTGLTVARDLAVTRDARVTVCSSATGATCEAGKWADGWIVFLDSNSNHSKDAGEEVFRAESRKPAESVSSSQFASFLIYRPNGRIMINDIRHNTGEFTLCDQRGSAHALMVSIDMSGRPRVSNETLAGSQPTCP